MDPLVWSILLLLLGLLLVFLEIFVPSGGLLGLTATGCVLGAIVLAFYNYPDRPWVGIVFLVVSVVGATGSLAAALKWFPDTPIGRLLLLKVPQGEEVLPDSDQRRALRELVGKQGRATCPMLPSGAISIDGRTIDAVSEGMAIDKGQPVTVVEVRGNLVVVRPADQQPQEVKKPRRAEDDLLSQPIDQLGLDPLEDPLG